MDIPGNSEKQPSESNEALASALKRNRLQLMWWSQEGLVLDREVLPDHVVVIEEAEKRSLGWPTLETGFTEYAGGQQYFSPNQAQNDERFAREAYEGLDKGGFRGFNSFPTSLGTRPYGGVGQSIKDFITAEGAAMSDLFYGTRPSYMRAHLLLPDFMEPLRAEMSQTGDNGWRAAIERYNIEQTTPEDERLVRSVRFAYGLMINLMDRDDRQRQARWDGSEGDAGVITNPHDELWA